MVEGFLTWMKNHKKDYTNSFRELSENKISFEDEEGKAWFAKYKNRLAKENAKEKKRQSLLMKSNPKYILRNYLAQEAIEAAQQGDLSALNKLLDVLKNPFSENKKYNEFSKAPPKWGKKLEISCSS